MNHLTDRLSSGGSTARFEWLESSLESGSSLSGWRSSKPLSPRQQRALFRALRKPGASAREREQIRSRLVVGTLQIVQDCARRIAGRRRLSELLQEGALALVRSVDAFVASNRDDFTRFAVVRVARWLRRIQRRWVRERALRVDTPIEGFPDALVSDPFSAASQVELQVQLEVMLGRLPAVQQSVLRLRFGIGVRAAQDREAVSRDLRLQQQRVRYLEERALLTLRRRAERERAQERRTLAAPAR